MRVDTILTIVKEHFYTNRPPQSTVVFASTRLGAPGQRDDAESKEQRRLNEYESEYDNGEDREHKLFSFHSMSDTNCVLGKLLRFWFLKQKNGWKYWERWYEENKSCHIRRRCLIFPKILLDSKLAEMLLRWSIKKERKRKAKYCSVMFNISSF